MKQMQKSKGFTLIEIMVVVGIIGILSAIAIPAYRDYVIRGKLPEAFATMADARVKMELYFQDNPATGFGGTTSPNACDEPTIVKYVAGTGLKYFTFTCSVTNANAYLLTMSGKSSEGLGSLVYTVDEQNQQRTTSVPTALGWTGAPASCWVRKKDGSC